MLMNTPLGLEVGDYFPFVSIKFCNGYTKHVHNFCDDKDILLFHCKNIDMIPVLKNLKDFISLFCFLMDNLHHT